jgi:hypothetical protein
MEHYDGIVTLGDKVVVLEVGELVVSCTWDFLTVERYRKANCKAGCLI